MMKNKHLSSRSLQSHIKNNTTCKKLSYNAKITINKMLWGLKVAAEWKRVHRKGIV